MPSPPVKQFIRNVRAAKTIADERAVVQKESAAIRASFREESHDSNFRSDMSSRVCALFLLTLLETEQCGKVVIPLYTGRKNPFWSNRMSETPSITPFRGQAVRIFGDYASAGREPGSPYTRHQLASEVSEHQEAHHVPC
jgi:hypothetical protein